MPALTITDTDGPDLEIIQTIADGRAVSIGPGLLDMVQKRCNEARDALRDGRTVYGVNTGMGALSGVRVIEQQQLSYQRNVLLARASGGPPWLGRSEVRAIIVVRLLTFLSCDAAVSGALCEGLAAFLNSGIVPAVPRSGIGAAGEIMQLAHAFGPLVGIGQVVGPDGVTLPAGRALRDRNMSAFSLGQNGRIALVEAVPRTTGLCVLRLREAARLPCLIEASSA